jgi:hypothetical protein
MPSALAPRPCQQSPFSRCPVQCRVQGIFPQKGCKVTLDRKTILQCWRDPQNCLWRVMIVDDGWMTKLTIRNVARFVIPLSTTPTGHLTNSMPIVPSKSNTTVANSLNECSNTSQLTNYYLCVSTTPSSPLSPKLLTEVISRVGGDYHLNKHAVTSQSCQNPKWDTWINSAKESNQLYPLQHRATSGSQQL